MMIPNAYGMYQAVIGLDKYSNHMYGPAAKWPCAIVSLDAMVSKTPIRADSSASRANADEDVVTALILFPIAVTPDIGGRFQIAGRDLRVLSVEPRFATGGRQDHWEVGFEAWPDGDGS